MTPELTPLAAAPDDQIEALLDAAFGADRRQRTAYRLRIGATPIPELSFAAWDGDRLVGTLQSWPVMLRSVGGMDRLVMVGPVAVLPDLQRSGVGKALMAALIRAADGGGSDAMMMIGDADYYARFGFTADHSSGWRIDGPYEQHRLLARLNRQLPRDGDLISAIQSSATGIPAFAGAAE